MPKKQEVRWGEIGTIRRMRDMQNVILYDKLFDYLSKLDMAIVQVRMWSTSMRISSSGENLSDQ
jgi:hypothetical protein